MGPPAGEERDGRGLAALILAAGRSTRMTGGSKLLCDFEGMTVIRRVASTALSAGLEPVVVVLGHDARAVQSALSGLVVRYARVPGVPRGRLVSVIAGIEAVTEDPVLGAMVLLGDEPGLTADDIRTVREAAAADRSIVWRAVFRDRPGHPVLLPEPVLRSVPDLARGHEPEFSLWNLIVRSGLPHSSVPIEGQAPVDIDTRDDLERAIQRSGIDTQRVDRQG